MAGSAPCHRDTFVFDTVQAKYGSDLAPEDEKIAQAMLNYWVSFAKTGDPSTGNTPAWPRYSPETDMLLDFTENGPVAEKDPLKARLDVTAAYVTSSAPRQRQSFPPAHKWVAKINVGAPRTLATSGLRTS